MNKRGFTLIEFLVVAVLLGILMTLAIGSYTRSLSRGRDAKRVTDMKEVQKSFELYYSLNNRYESVCSAMFTNQTGRQPVPPRGGLIYFGACTATDYRYCTRLENGEYGNYSCSADIPSTTCNPADTSQTHYCVINAQ